MELGVYTAVLHDRTLREALGVITDLGLTGAEVNAGGFVGTPHLPVEEVLSSDAARDDYLGVFAEAGVRLTGLNVNGNPLHPDPVGERHAADLHRAVELAGRLGVRRVVAMSGLPGAGSPAPNWVVNPWSTDYLDVLDAQWDLAVPFWRDVDHRARDAGTTVAIEMHPQNLVFNPATLERLVERTGATNVGAEMDPSHLFWQGIDPVAAVEHLGELVLHAAAKDVRINPSARVHGVLDDRYRRLAPEEDRVNLGGDHWLNDRPADAAWHFVAVGRGHDAAYWARFLDALAAVDPEMAVNIEHEDVELGRVEGLEVAARTLREATSRRTEPA